MNTQEATLPSHILEVWAAGQQTSLEPVPNGVSSAQLRRPTPNPFELLVRSALSISLTTSENQNPGRLPAWPQRRESEEVQTWEMLLICNCSHRHP